MRRSGPRFALAAAVLAAAPAATVLVVPQLAPAPAAAVERFPEPALVPTTWELEFEYKTPKRIVVEIPGERRPKAFWYITYTVTNPGNEAVEFLPQFDMLTEDGQVIRSDRALPKQVFEAVRKREGNNFLEPASRIEGPVQPGEDNAREGVAIWAEPTHEMGEFSIFVGGLSGEFATMKRTPDGWTKVDPDKAQKELEGVAEKDRMTLRKTLHLTFHVPGDKIRPGEDPVIKRGQKWVMR